MLQDLAVQHSAMIVPCTLMELHTGHVSPQDMPSVRFVHFGHFASLSLATVFALANPASAARPVSDKLKRIFHDVCLPGPRHRVGRSVDTTFPRRCAVFHTSSFAVTLPVRRKVTLHKAWSETVKVWKPQMHSPPAGTPQKRPFQRSTPNMA